MKGGAAPSPCHRTAELGDHQHRPAHLIEAQVHAVLGVAEDTKPGYLVGQPLRFGQGVGMGDPDQDAEAAADVADRPSVDRHRRLRHWLKDDPHPAKVSAH